MKSAVFQPSAIILLSISYAVQSLCISFLTFNYINGSIPLSVEGVASASFAQQVNNPDLSGLACFKM